MEMQIIISVGNLIWHEFSYRHTVEYHKTFNSVIINNLDSLNTEYYTVFQTFSSIHFEFQFK